ncbi:MAG TPA: TlyA family RNA methyltransferase [Anaerolineae bacterium]|nr:TlyA family RNA methyltransferase [Anaerolineae bacterium]
MAQKTRIDLLLVERGLVESRSQAQRLIMAGQVRVNDQVVNVPSRKFVMNAQITLESGPRFVSRGGEKLASALETFATDIEGKICADVGVSTGGFTDCLLQAGAARVYAIDVGRGVLHWKLRNHPKVVVMEGVNAREIESLPEPIQLVTIDASFISLRILIPSVVRWLDRDAEVIALIKPQFEAGREAVGKGGVVRDPLVHQRVVRDVIDCAVEANLGPQAVMISPLRGPKGNLEFLLWCIKNADGVDTNSLLESVQLSICLD